MFALLFALAFAVSGESIHRAPAFQIYQYDSKLEAFFGKEGSSLCFPSSLAHRMMYFQSVRQPTFSKLKIVSDPVENVKTFVKLCRTSPANGTSQRRKVPCIEKFIKASGLKGEAWSIGRDATDKKLRRAVRVSDIVSAIRSDDGVILHVGWYKLEGKKWVSHGSHSLNAYGFDIDGDHVKLQLANPGMDYSDRPAGRMFDFVEIKPLAKEAGLSYPSRTELVLDGPGFDRKDRLAILENVYFFRITDGN